MKRTVLIIIALLLATTLFAGGKECDMNHSGNAVTLTGSLVRTGDGDAAKTVFRVANSDQSYTVCEKTKASILNLSTGSPTLRVKGKVVTCGGNEELMIESAQKI
jgi:hypothetical protein